MYAMPDRSLPEAIAALQRLELPGDTRRLVDEAADLLGNGREMEARALVEKAEALTTLSQPTARTAQPRPNGSTNPEDNFPQLCARLVAPITAAIASALIEVHRDSADQARMLGKNVEECLAHMAGEIGDLRKTDETLMHQVQELDERVAGCDQRLSTVEQSGAGFAAGIAEVGQRIDHQTELLRAMQERHARRTALLNEVLGNIARLRDQPPAEGEPAA